MKTYEFRELFKDVEFSRDDTVLDIGCGTGWQTVLIGRKCGKIIGIDIFDKDLAIANFINERMRGRANCEIRKTRIEDAGFADGFFDKVLSICVIEHIPNYTEVLQEAYRTLKKGGRLIITVDSLGNIDDAGARERHRKEYAVEKYFTREELESLLKKTGFRDIEVYPIFKSNYAVELFLKRLDSSVRYGFINSLAQEYKLEREERKCRNAKTGVFLAAKCRK
ncbi:MAG: class I SAM-dependent methyltransferase [Deltaproteobacteria bacterium]|nr:class I SAM-dependent methyltransferase [Deltaproteobacteria bacterium]